jgi:hypothetical protein
VTNASRDSLKIAYYYDKAKLLPKTYPNGSTDDAGDPDLTTGYLYSTQIPGYALLFASQSPLDVNTDNLTQPFALSYASIRVDKWDNKRDMKCIFCTAEDI